MSSPERKSKWQEYKEKNGIPSPYLHVVNVNKKLAQERIDVCRACPELVSEVDQCKKCGCFIGSKTRLESAQCPLGKW